MHPAQNHSHQRPVPPGPERQTGQPRPSPEAQARALPEQTGMGSCCPVGPVGPTWALRERQTPPRRGRPRRVAPTPHAVPVWTVPEPRAYPGTVAPAHAPGRMSPTHIPGRYRSMPIPLSCAVQRRDQFVTNRPGEWRLSRNPTSFAVVRGGAHHWESLVRRGLPFSDGAFVAWATPSGTTPDTRQPAPRLHHFRT